MGLGVSRWRKEIDDLDKPIEREWGVWKRFLGEVGVCASLNEVMRSTDS